MTQTYRETLVQNVTEIETLMRALFKAEGAPPIPFAFYDLRDRTERAFAIKRVTDDYILAHTAFNDANRRRYFERGGSGEGPALVPVDTALLDRLADVLLYEDLTDEHPDKVARNEYPIMSDRQLETRRSGEVGTKLAEDYGTDRRNHREPKRRQRTRRENATVDQYARIRNRERAAQYRKDTAPGPKVEYNLRDTYGELTEPFVACVGIADSWRAAIAPERQ